MLQKRIIPVLLLRNKGLVKTVQFDKHKYIGDPINAIKIFNDKEVDELVFLDIDASKQGREPDFEYLEKIASECFMPLGYGGGISNVGHIRRLFATGFEKAIINTAALQNVEFIRQAAALFGSQSIVVSVDVKRTFWGNYEVFSHAKCKIIHKDVFTYVRLLQDAGAGELVLNSVDLDGTMKGYDLKLIKQVCEAVKIPVVVCGGAGRKEDFSQAANAGASALAAGSLFVYHGPHKAVLINYPTQEELKEILA